MALTDEELRSFYDLECRAKYTQAEIDDLGKKGEAFGPDEDGHYSYPIADEDDLRKAIKAVGRGNADHDAIRKFIIGRAKALKLSSLVPDNWNADGSLKETDAHEADEQRHAAYTGTHTHSHTAGGDQGDDDTHEHEHSHDGDSDHGHSHERAGGTDRERRRRRADRLGNGVRIERSFAFRLESRAVNDDGTLHFSGYASVTNVPYDMGWYTETVSRGAFRKTLSENPDVQLVLNHGNGGSGLPLARTGVNMTLVEDTRGLRVDGDLDPEDPDVQLLDRKLSAGLVDQMSFAFVCRRQSWNDEYTERSILEADIHRGDVSVVNQGASPTTSAALERGVEVLRGVVSVLEARAGKTLSGSTMAVLTDVLKLVATADEAVDEALPKLSRLMGVDNPDADEAACSCCDQCSQGCDGACCDGCDMGSDDGPDTLAAGPLPDCTTRSRLRLAELRHYRPAEEAS